MKTLLKPNHYAWLLWLLSSTFLFYKYVLQVFPSIVTQELTQHFQLTAHGLGFVAACYFYAYLLMQLPGGVLLDHLDLRQLLAGAVGVCALGAIVFAHSTTVWQAVVGRLLIGFGGAFSAIGTMKLISLFFPARQFALVSSLMMTIGILGAVGGQGPLVSAVHHYGWQASLYQCGVAGLCLALLLALVIDTTDTSSDYPKLTWQQVISQCRRIVFNRQSWWVSLFSGLAFAPISAYAGLWGVPFIMLKCHIDKATAAHIMALTFWGFAIGCPLSGYWSDQLGQRKPLMLLGTLIGCLCLLVILYGPFVDSNLYRALHFALGFFTSFFFISFALIRECHDASCSGTSIGFINSFDALIGAIAEPAIGYCLDYRWHGQMHGLERVYQTVDYQWSLLLLPLGMILGLIIGLRIRETYCQSPTNDDASRIDAGTLAANA